MTETCLGMNPIRSGGFRRLAARARTAGMLVGLAGLAAAGNLSLAGSANAAGTLVYCSEGNPDQLAPSLARTNTSFDVLLHVYDTLVRYDKETDRLVPSLAESWTISEDGREYTFKLRKDTRFHSSDTFTPTRTLSAQDVLFSIERQWKKDHPYHQVGNGAYNYFNDLSLGTRIKALDALDDHTLRFTLSEPTAPFLGMLSMVFSAVTSEEYGTAMLAAGTPELLDSEPIGTGAFQMVSYRKDAAVRFRAFEDHWAGRPPLDGLVFAITPNASVRLNRVQSGECHLMPYPLLTDLPRVKGDDSLTLLSQEGYNVSFLTFNVKSPPLDDLRVRRAIAMAINKPALVDAIYGETGRLARNPLPPSSWGYHEAMPDQVFDPDQAIKLLAEAGHSGGLDIELWHMPVARPYMPNAKRAAEMMANDLARVGIRTKLVTDDWSVYMKRLMHGDHQLGMIGWTGDNADPDNFLYTLLSCEGARVGGGNMTKWCNAEFDNLIIEAKRVTDQARRRDLYFAAQEVFHREVPWLSLAHANVFMVLRQEVKGYQMNPFGLHLFHKVDLAN